MDAKTIKSQAIKMKADMQKVASREIAKAKLELKKAEKLVEAYVKKNPEKAAVISAGIGAALGATIAALIRKAGNSKKK
ncbi:MAG: hypothetical protein WCO05_02095 [Candidatus Moraniibacteriota bacterium]|jgi:ElaB/YqjD/DUF883 family membrane-anchored ribosome-binding protein